MYCRFALIVLLSIFVNACSDGNSGGNPSNPPFDPPSGTPLVNPQDVLSVTDNIKYDDTNIVFQALSPDEKHMYAFAKYGKLYSGRLIYFTLNETTGTYEYTKNILADSELNYVPSILVSPDDSQVYVSFEIGIAIFNRDLLTGDLTYSSEFTASMIPGGLSFGQMIFTNDGDFLYVYSSSYGEVAVFSRDSQTGSIMFVEKQSFSNTFLESFTVSLDNKYLYQLYHDKLIVTEIDAPTGLLTQIQNFGGELLPEGEFASFGHVSDISMNADGTKLYMYGFIQLRNPTWSRLLHKEGLLVADRDSSTGIVSYKQFVAINESTHIVSPYDGSSMAVVGDYVYVQDTQNIDKKADISVLYTFSKTIDNTTEFSGKVVLGEHLGGQDIGNTVKLISSQVDLLPTYEGRIFQLFINSDDGSISQTNRLFIDVDEVDGLGFASYIVASPDGNNIYVIGKDGGLSAYKFDSSTGAIQHLQTIYAKSNDFFPDLQGVYFFGVPNFNGGFGVGTMDISADGKFIYLVGANRIIALARDLSTGILSRADSPSLGIFDFQIIGDKSNPQSTEVPIFYEAGEEGFGSFGLYSIEISPDGEFIYAAGRVANDNAAVAVLARDESNGDLTLIELIDTASIGTRELAPRPPIIASSIDKNNVYFVNQHDGLLINFSRDQITGRLEILEGLQGVEFIEVSNITFGLNGKYMYVAADEIALSPFSFGGVFQNTVSMLVFERDQATGELTLVQLLEKNGEDADGNILNSGIIQGGIRHSAINSSGTELYALTQSQRTIYKPKVDNGLRLDVYLIDQNDGSLSLVQKLDEGLVGLGISSVAASQASNHVFVTNEVFNSLSVLE